MPASNPCPICTCTTDDNGAHALLAALCEDDLDAALALGLLGAQACPSCSAVCNATLVEARDARRFALAARTRYRARAERLQRRKAERTPPSASIASTAPALPTGAADALARALAKARERQSR